MRRNGVEEWKECRLKDIVEINPTESLKKGTVAKKIGMDVLQPYCRAIPSFSFEPYTGGTKFKNGDTIMARITPCLENGKTAMVNILDDNEIGFGSTEYIVFRAKNNITDPYFIYYLVTSDCIRNPAIKSMVGSSGHQRVQTDVVANLSIKLPPLPTQQKIADILSSLDDKIELNNKINTNLEQQAQALFKNWFVDFEPFGGKMPEEWKVGKLCDIADYSSEKIEINKLSPETYYSTENMLPSKGGIETATSLPSISQTTRCLPGETIISNIRPYFKKIFYCTEEVAGCSTDVLCFKPKYKDYSEYLYQVLYSDIFFDYMVLGSKGTKMPRGDKQQIMNYPITIPNELYLRKFKTFAEPIFSQIDLNRKENKRLSELRDTLLPKLMNGEIKV